MTSRDRNTLWLIGLLFLVRIAATWYGYDRRPVITSNDEIYWAEPAWAMMHGKGYTMPCLAGTRFADSYSVHPPLYSFILMGQFWVGGFTVPSLRLGTLIAHLTGVAVMLIIWRRLWQLQIIDRFGFVAASLLLLANFSTLSLARGGRPDCYCILFSLLPFLILLAGPMTSEAVRRRAWLAAPWLGLALATHTVASFYYGIFLLALVALGPKLGRWRAVAIAAIPPLLFGTIWLLTFGNQSYDALIFHLQTASFVGGSDIPVWQGLKVLASGDWTYLLQVGGTTTFLILAVIPLLVVRWSLDGGRAAPVPWLWVGGALALMAVFVLRLTGLKLSRGAVYLPLTLTIIGVLLTRFPRGWWRLLSVAIVAVFVLADVAQITYATISMRRTWEERAPSRFDHWLDRIPTGAKVAVIPPVWFQVRARGLDVQMIDTCVPILDDYWMKTPDVFADRDIVILPSDHPLARDPRLMGASHKETQLQLGTELTLFVLNPAKFQPPQ